MGDGHAYVEIFVKYGTDITVAKVDAADHALVAQHKWRYQPRGLGNANGALGYAKTTVPIGGKRRSLYMHRLIMGLAHGDVREVDHLNRDRLDNRRVNLLVVSRQQNLFNRPLTNASTYYGVHLGEGRSNKPWRAVLYANSQRYHLGWFASPTEAAQAYDAALWEMYGSAAMPRLNFPAQYVTATAAPAAGAPPCTHAGPAPAPDASAPTQPAPGAALR